jgi:transcriptional antiterminator NusG
MGVEEKRVDANFEIGETVKVKAGPFANFTGTIEEMDKDKAKLKVLVNMFGRDTPVELDFTQIEKLS